jgi:hypothetical protein
MQKDAANVPVMLEIEDRIVAQQKRKQGCKQSIYIYCTRGCAITNVSDQYGKPPSDTARAREDFKDRIIKNWHFRHQKMYVVPRSKTADTSKLQGLLNLKEAEKGTSKSRSETIKHLQDLESSL